MDASAKGAAKAAATRAAALSSDAQRFGNKGRFGTSGSAAAAAFTSVSLELRILGVLLLLLLFLLFLIALLWDRYGREIGELYTPSAARGGTNGSSSSGDTGGGSEGNANAVADEYTMYQKLPTFFYEYTPRKKQQ